MTTGERELRRAIEAGHFVEARAASSTDWALVHRTAMGLGAAETDTRIIFQPDDAAGTKWTMTAWVTGDLLRMVHHDLTRERILRAIEVAEKDAGEDCWIVLPFGDGIIYDGDVTLQIGEPVPDGFAAVDGGWRLTQHVTCRRLCVVDGALHSRGYGVFAKEGVYFERLP